MPFCYALLRVEFFLGKGQHFSGFFKMHVDVDGLLGCFFHHVPAFLVQIDPSEIKEQVFIVAFDFQRGQVKGFNFCVVAPLSEFHAKLVEQMGGVGVLV